jgi:Ca2+/H+ antiporter, TMEM165/GDT1 family
MDFKLFSSTFLAIFLAEMGDKTQIATLSLAAGAHSRWTVFVGAASGLILTSALAVVGGDVISRYVSATWLRRAAGLTFLVLGALYLFGVGED